MVRGALPLITVRDTPRRSIMMSWWQVASSLQPRPDRVGDATLPFRGRMNAVGLVQCRDAGHVVEKERNQGDVALAGHAHDRPRGSRACRASPKFGGASMPSSSTRMRRASRLFDDRRQVRPQFSTAPVHAARRWRRARRRSTRTSPCSDQSRRRNPPADVSPETPALTTS